MNSSASSPGRPIPVIVKVAEATFVEEIRINLEGERMERRAAQLNELGLERQRAAPADGTGKALERSIEPEEALVHCGNRKVPPCQDFDVPALPYV